MAQRRRCSVTSTCRCSAYRQRRRSTRQRTRRRGDERGVRRWSPARLQTPSARCSTESEISRPGRSGRCRRRRIAWSVCGTKGESLGSSIERRTSSYGSLKPPEDHSGTTPCSASSSARNSSSITPHTALRVVEQVDLAGTSARWEAQRANDVVGDDPPIADDVAVAGVEPQDRVDVHARPLATTATLSAGAAGRPERTDADVARFRATRSSVTGEKSSEAGPYCIFALLTRTHHFLERTRHESTPWPLPRRRHPPNTVRYWDGEQWVGDPSPPPPARPAASTRCCNRTQPAVRRSACARRSRP